MVKNLHIFKRGFGGDGEGRTDGLGSSDGRLFSSFKTSIRMRSARQFNHCKSLPSFDKTDVESLPDLPVFMVDMLDLM